MYYWNNGNIVPKHVQVAPEQLPPEPVRCIFAYDLSASVPTLFKAVGDFYAERYGPDAFMMFREPTNVIDYIIVLDRLVIEQYQLKAASRYVGSWPSLIAHEAPNFPSFEYLVTRLEDLMRQRHLLPYTSRRLPSLSLDPFMDATTTRATYHSSRQTSGQEEDPYEWRMKPPLFDEYADNPLGE